MKLGLTLSSFYFLLFLAINNYSRVEAYTVTRYCTGIVQDMSLTTYLPGKRDPLSKRWERHDAE